MARRARNPAASAPPVAYGQGMHLFRRSPQQQPLPADPVRRVATPWSDGIGRLAIRAIQIIIVVVLLAGIIWGIRQVTVVIIPLILALIFAAAFAPVVTWMRRHGVPALVATLITLLAVVGILGGLGWVIYLAVRDQWDELSESATQGFQQAVNWAQDLPFAPTQDQLDEWTKSLQDFLTSSQFGSGALAGVSAIATFLTGFVLLVVILFFFLKDGPRMWEFVLRPFHGTQYDRAQRVGHKAITVLGSYVRGTASVAAVDAIGILIGLLILQVPLAIPLAVLVFLLAFIPIVGAVTAGALAAAVALVAQGPVIALIVVGIVVAVNQLEGNFLQPVLMGRTLKLHSFVVLVVLAGGTAIGGILGTLLAVPITAVVWGVIQVWDGPDTPARWARPKRRERIEAAQPTVG
jgi:putative heme transporter